MASKLCVVFLLLFICQVCFTARIPRQSDASTETPTTTTTKTDEDAEEFNQMKLELEKMLNPDEKREFNEIITNITMAKTLDEGIVGALQLINFGMQATLKNTEASTTTPA